MFQQPLPLQPKSALRTQQEEAAGADDKDKEPPAELDDTFFSGLDGADSHDATQTRLTFPEEEDREVSNGRHGMAPQRWAVTTPTATTQEEEDNDDNGGGDDANSSPTTDASPTTPYRATAWLSSSHYHAPPSAQPPAHTTFSAFHSERYAHFIRCYVGALDEEVEKAKNLARRMTMIGISKVVQRNDVHVRTVRNFAKHSVLSVEGDAVFVQLIRWAQEVERSAAAKLAQLAPVEEEEEEQHQQQRQGNSIKNNESIGAYSRRARKDVVAHAELRQPNARCIALHYGLPPNGDAGTPSAYPQATLIVVVASTRLEENTEVHISLESYQRCLDEAAWYRHRYGHVLQSLAQADQSKKDGDVLTGIKHFSQWPPHLPYYHGVGRQHASSVAEASFPFTLLNLEETPEFGKGELGVTAALPVPYATCFLYTGPSVAAKNIAQMKNAAESKERERSHEKKKKKTLSPLPSEKDDDDEEELDDTYALGLGQLGVCFGQGLARYINHRYNVSRYGTVELCSVMLTVQSEFVRPPLQQKNKLASPAKRNGREKKNKVDTIKEKTARKHMTDAVTEGGVNREGVTTAVIASFQKGNTATAVVLPSSREIVPAQKAKESHKRKKRRAVFLEEQSHFITVPFFIVTSDIAPGEQLLAWSYGDDYDAKLERQVIADGYLVPYVDAALLNERYHQHFPNGVSSRVPWPLWQRYNGDYRYALHEGDVVWRRRPLLSSPQRCAPAEEDLFLLVRTLRTSMEYVLLLPLVRAELTEKQLDSLLLEQDLLDYRSPVAPAAMQPTNAKSAVKRVKVDERAQEQKERMAAWAVFPYQYQKEDKSKLPRKLQRCVVATADTVVPLLLDTDYYMAHANVTTAAKKNAATSASGRKPQVVVNLHDLRHVTSLVLDHFNGTATAPIASRTRTNSLSLHVAPLYNGLLWPLVYNACTVSRRNERACSTLYSTPISSPEQKKTETNTLLSK